MTNKDSAVVLVLSLHSTQLETSLQKDKRGEPKIAESIVDPSKSSNQQSDKVSIVINVEESQGTCNTTNSSNPQSNKGNISKTSQPKDF